jgi:predicted ATP-grasp superfamily ATP-dependent carboligase
MTGDLLKQRKLERQSRNKYHSKRVESEILIELKNTLDEYLKDNDSVMIEVNPRVLGEFITITDSISAIYEYEQQESNLFVFRNRELF